MKRYFTLIPSLFLIWLSNIAMAQTPANDNFTNATLLTLDQNNKYLSTDAAFTNAEATADGNQATYGYAPKRNVWYKFVASSTSVTIKVESGGSKGNLLFGSLSLWEDIDTDISSTTHAASSQGEIIVSAVNLTVGNTYYIAVDSYDLQYAGTFTLSIDPQATNDFKEGAIELTNINNYCSNDAEFNSYHATPDGPTLNSGYGPYFNVWFKFTATAETINIKLLNGGAQGNHKYGYITLWDDNLNEIANNSHFTSQGEVQVGSTSLTVGNTYYISVDCNHQAYRGTFSLCIDTQPSNDYIEGATLLTDQNDWCSEEAEFNSFHGTPDGPATANGYGPYYNVWFKFVATTNAATVKLIDGGTFGNLRYGYLTLWDENIQEMSQSVLNLSQGTVQVGSVNLTPGKTYYVSVDCQVAAYRGTFSLCLDNQPTYDFKEGALELTHENEGSSADAAYTNMLASGDGIKPVNGPNPTHNIWFKFVAQKENIFIKVQTGNEKGTLRYANMALWDASDNEISSVSYTSDYSDLEISSSNLTIGNTYYISVDCHLYPYRGSFTLCIEGLKSIEREALETLYASTNGGTLGEEGVTWNGTNWLTAAPLEDWEGITTNANGKVTSIVLQSKGLSGVLPAEIGNLTNLTNLNVSANYNLGGTLPTEIWDLTNLTSLNLRFNIFSGSLAGVKDLTNLTELYVHSNGFTGEILPEIVQLTNLKKLHLNSNNFSGSIPSEIKDLSQLEILHLGFNNFNGTVPPEIGELTNLVNLGIGYNAFTSGSALPIEIWDLSNLTSIDLRGLYLTGTLGAEIANMTNLRELTIGDNQFSGGLEYIDELEFLEQIHILNNNFDQLPDLSNLENIKNIYVNGNSFDFYDIEPNLNVASGTFNYLNQQYAPISFDGTTLSVDVGGTEHRWYKGGDEIAITASNTFVPTEIGTYRVFASKIEVSGLSIASETIEITEINYTNQQDRDALTAIYNAIFGESQDPASVGFTNWKTNADLDQWAFVDVNAEGRVNSLNLGGMGIPVLDPAIGNLSELEYLDLSNNTFASLPVNEINSLTKLIRINLDDNKLDFSSLVPLQNAANTFICNSQFWVEIVRDGNTLTVNNIEHGNEVYKWYKHKWYTSPEEVGQSRSIVADDMDFGYFYFCEITNPDYTVNPNFNLFTRKVDSSYPETTARNKSFETEFNPITESKLYPNPVNAGSDLTLEIPNTNNELVKVAIFNLSGQMVKEISSYQSEITISTVRLEIGLYIVKYQSSFLSGMKKIIIE